MLFLIPQCGQSSSLMGHKCLWFHSDDSKPKMSMNGHHFDPIDILAWIKDGQSHPICPVMALCYYLDATSQVSRDHPFVRSTYLAPCSEWNRVQVACEVIDTAEPDKAPPSQDIRKAGIFLIYCTVLMPLLRGSRRGCRAVGFFLFPTSVPE